MRGAPPWRSLLAVLALALVRPGLPPAAGAEGGRDRRPNILFILSDDHAAHAVSAYGSRLLRTPHLDRLAREGMLFSHCFVTNSICAPSRASILTGKYSHRHGVTVFNRFDGSQPTFPKLLRAAGYQTALIGKWHLESDPTGFDHWSVLPGQGDYVDPVMIENGRKTMRPGYATDIITDLCLEFLEKRDPSRPFLLLCHHKAPHRDWVPAARHRTLFESGDLPLPETFDDDYRGRSAAAAEATLRIERDFTRGDLKEDPPAGLSAAELKRWKYQRYIKDYLRCVTAVDEGVGRLLDHLGRSDLAASTLVIYTSDQGFFLGEHGWYDKRFMYEESLRMPLLLRFPPLVRPGSVCERMVLNVDFAPTLLELAGLAVPGDMQGRSLVPLLSGGAPTSWRTSMYYRFYHYPQHHRVHPHQGVRTERYKLIHYDLLDEWELFDLKADPLEIRNLATDPAHEEVGRRLREELARLKREVGDDDSYLLPQSLLLPVEAPPGLVLRYDFAETAGGLVRDASGNGRDAFLLRAWVGGPGRRGRAARLEGDGSLEVEASRSPDPSRRAFLAGAWGKPGRPSGVLLAQGGTGQGYSLYLLEGIPHFAVRSGEALFFARGREAVAPGRWVHLAGGLDASGRLRLWVNGRLAAETPGVLIERKPAEGLSVGADRGSTVGAHSDPLGWHGLLEDVRFYQGPPDDEVLEEWSSRAGRF